MRWRSMTWSFMMINFFRRTIHVPLAMQTCPRSWINLLFLTQPKNQNWVLMSSCVWMHLQTSLNFRGWSVCRFYRALMQCHLLQKFLALDLCALGARSTIQRARQYGWGDQGLLLASLLGWSPKEKAYSVQLLAVSFPVFCQQFSWKDVKRKTWWWPAWTWEMLFWLWSKSETPWSIQQMQVEQLAVFLWEGAAWTTWWKLAVLSCNHQLPQIKAWLGGAHPISMHSSFKRWILRGDDTCWRFAGGWKVWLCVGQVPSGAQSCIWYFSSMHWEARWWADIFETTVYTSWWWKVESSNAWEAHHPALQFAWTECSKPE